MLVVADIDEVFLPTRQGILVNPQRSRYVPRLYLFSRIFSGLDFVGQ